MNATTAFLDERVAGGHAERAEDLAALAAGRLAAHQRPRRIVLVDALPARTATGRLQRFALRERVARG